MLLVSLLFDFNSHRKDITCKKPMHNLLFDLKSKGYVLCTTCIRIDTCYAQPYPFFFKRSLSCCYPYPLLLVSMLIVSLIEDFNKLGLLKSSMKDTISIEGILRALVFNQCLLKSSIRDTKKKYAFSVSYLRF